MIFHNACHAGVGANLLNVTYSYVNEKYISEAMAIKNSISGICGFLASLAASALLANIQAKITSVDSENKEKIQNNIDELGKAIKQSIFLAIAPDYEKGEKVVSGTTLERSGWINWDGSDIADGAHIWLKVNGIEVCRHSKYKYGSRYKTMIYVGAGDTVTLSGGNGAVFYPCKGFGEAE